MTVWPALCQLRCTPPRLPHHFFGIEFHAVKANLTLCVAEEDLEFLYLPASTSQVLGSIGNLIFIFPILSLLFVISGLYLLYLWTFSH